MNWTTLLRFRKQVEDLAREEVVLAEWEKSGELATRDDLSREMETVVAAFEQEMQGGIETLIAEERYRWLKHIGIAMEARTEHIHRLEKTLVTLRQTLKEAYHARRVVELVIKKKETVVLQKAAAQEQRIQEDLSAHAFATCHIEEMTY